MDLQTLALAKNYTDKQIEKAELNDIELDTSLKKKGFAADSKAVGDALEQNKFPELVLSKEIGFLNATATEEENAFLSKASKENTSFIGIFKINLENYEGSYKIMMCPATLNEGNITAFLGFMSTPVKNILIMMAPTENESEWIYNCMFTDIFDQYELINKVVSGLPASIPNVEADTGVAGQVPKVKTNDAGRIIGWELGEVDLPVISLSQPVPIDNRIELTVSEATLIEDIIEKGSNFICKGILTIGFGFSVLMSATNDGTEIIYSGCGIISTGGIMYIAFSKINDVWGVGAFHGPIYDPNDAANYTISVLPKTIPQIQKASVGQLISVKAVDSAGIPTDWEVVTSQLIPDTTEADNGKILQVVDGKAAWVTKE